MIGVSGQPGLFSEEIVKEMHRHCPRPVIMPLSNPTSRAEAQPQDLIAGHRAPRSLSPAARLRRCSGRASSTILPSVITPMYSRAGAGYSGLPCTPGHRGDADGGKPQLGRAVAAGDNRKGGLLPPVDHIETVSRHIAFAVARAAIEQGVAPAMEDEMLLARIEETVASRLCPVPQGCAGPALTLR